VSLNFDEVSVLEDCLPKRPCELTAVVKGPLRQANDGLTVEDQRSDLINVPGIPLESLARERKPDGLAADGRLGLIGGDSGPIHAVVPARVYQESRPGSHGDFRVKHVLGRAVSVYRESCLELERGVILKLPAIDGSDDGRGVTAPLRDRDGDQGLQQEVPALMIAPMDDVEKPNFEATLAASAGDRPPVLPQPARSGVSAVDSHEKTCLSRAIKPGGAETTPQKWYVGSDAHPGRGNGNGFSRSLVPDVIESLGHVMPKHGRRSNGHVKGQTGLGYEHVTHGRQGMRGKPPGEVPEGLRNGTERALRQRRIVISNASGRLLQLQECEAVRGRLR
jgi:hypothetical protein